MNQKIKLTYCIFLLIFSFRNVNAQYNFEWSKKYDNLGLEQAKSITKSLDGYVYILAKKEDSLEYIWLIKLDNLGRRLFSKTIGGYKRFDPKRIIPTYDTNLCIVATVSEIDSAKSKIWLGKISKNGDLLWERLYEGIGYASATDFVQTSDSGFAISGYTLKDLTEYPDWYVLKVDKFGFFQWEQYYGTSYEDRATSITFTKDSKIVVGGYLSFEQGLYKRGTLSFLNLDGEFIWVTDFKYKKWSSINTITATSDTNLIVVVEVLEEALLNFDTYIYKLDRNGNKIWENKLSDNFMEHPVRVIETYDLGYALAYTWKAHGYGNTNLAVVKLSPLGNIIWEKIIFTKTEDYASDLIEGFDNSLLLAASIHTISRSWDVSLVKYKSVEASDIKISIPSKPLVSLNTEKMFIKGFIIGYKKPKFLEIYLNDVLVQKIENFEENTNVKFRFDFSLFVDLKMGQNIIKLVVTDYKDFVFSKKLMVYYIPDLTKIW